MIHQHYRQTDGQTTCDGRTALCTIVHRAVKLAEFNDTYTSASRWPPITMQELSWRLTFTLNCVTPKCTAFALSKVTITAALSIWWSLGNINISRHIVTDSTSSLHTGRTVAAFKTPSDLLGFPLYNSSKGYASKLSALNTALQHSCMQ